MHKKVVTTRTGVKRPVSSFAVEPLEGRRLLSVAYPVLVPEGDPADGPIPTASANGEAFVAISGRLYRSDGSTGGTSGIAGAFGPLFKWDGTLYTRAAPGFGADGLYKLEAGATFPVEIRSSDGLAVQLAQSFVAAGEHLYLLGSRPAQPFTSGV